MQKMCVPEEISRIGAKREEVATIGSRWEKADQMGEAKRLIDRCVVSRFISWEHLVI